MEAEIPVRLDTTGLRTQIRALQAELRSLGGIEIPVRADTTAARASLAQLRAATQRGAQFPIDTSGAQRNIQQFNQQFNQSSGTARRFRMLIRSIGTLGRAVFRGITTTLSQFGRVAGQIASGSVSSLRDAFSQLRESASQVGSSMTGALGAIRQILTSLAILGPMLVGVVGILSALVGVIQSAVGAITAGIAGLPVVIAGIAGPIAAIVLGSERLQEIFGRLSDTVERLQSSVGDAFENNLNIIGQLRELLLAIEQPLANVAAGLSRMANYIVDVVTSSRGMENIQNMFSGIEALIDGVTDSVARFIQESLAVAGTTELYDILAATISDVLNNFSRFLSQVRESGLLEDTLRSVRGLLDVIVDLFGDWAIAGMQFLNGAAPGIENFLDGLNRFFGSMDWEYLGNAFGRVFGAIGEAIATIPESTLRALEDAFVNFGNQIIRLVEAGLIDAFVQAFIDLVNVAALVASWFGDVLDVLEGVGDAIGAIVEVVQGLFEFIGNLGSATRDFIRDMIGLETSVAQGEASLEDFRGAMPGVDQGLSDLGIASGALGRDMQGLSGEVGNAAGQMSRDIGNLTNEVGSHMGQISNDITNNINGAISFGNRRFNDFANGVANSSSRAEVETRLMMAFIRETIRQDVAGYSSGFSIGADFASGISAAAGRVRAAAGSLVSAAAGYLPGSAAEVGPFSGEGWSLHRGRALVEDFGEGIRREFGGVQNTVAREMGRLATEFDEDPPIPSLTNVDRMVSSASRRASAQWQGEINDPRFGGVADRVAEALTSWELHMNRDGVVRLVNEGNRELERRR